MPKISLTLDDVKQIISEKYFKKHDVSPCDIEIFDCKKLYINNFGEQEEVTDDHFIIQFEIQRLDF
ncbi:MAG TPA: hypothetical protein VFM18_15595 [Methanosarcina sp.]|nr:hypothetical protein [Methanosarcina sp.]